MNPVELFFLVESCERIGFAELRNSFPRSLLRGESIRVSHFFCLKLHPDI